MAGQHSEVPTRWRTAARATGAVVTALLLAFSSTVAIALAATSLLMGGTGHPLSVPDDTPTYIEGYVDGASGTYIAPSGLCTGGKPGCTPLAVYTPEQFRFDTGLQDMTFDESVAIGQANLDDCIRRNPCTVTPAPWVLTGDQRLTDKSFVVYGYSQSATIATIEKRRLIETPEPGVNVSFIVTANPNRPHGGVLVAFPGLYIPIVGVTFNGATPTNSTMTTVDVARQYDIVPDLPTNPLNLLSDVNALMGNFYYHENYFDGGPPLRQGQYGDTTYYLIPTPVVPLVKPLQILPIIGPALAVTLDPFVRVLVETGYDRTINPGQPTPARFLYFPNPIHTLKNLAIAIPTGLDNGISYLAGKPDLRPFRTPIPTNPYGVNGPPVDTGCGTPPCSPPTPAALLTDPPLARTSTASPPPSLMTAKPVEHHKTMGTSDESATLPTAREPEMQKPLKKKIEPAVPRTRGATRPRHHADRADESSAEDTTSDRR